MKGVDEITLRRIDAALTHTYTTPLGERGRKSLSQLAKAFGVSKRKLIDRAVETNLTTRKGPKGTWDNPKENAVFERCLHMTSRAIQQNLKTAGFERSIESIAQHRHHVYGTRSDIKLADGKYSTTMLAGYLGVSETAVSRWVRQGLLAAKVEPDAGLAGGLAYIITDEAVRDFAHKHTAYFPTETADRYWLVGVLLNKHGIKAAA